MNLLILYVSLVLMRTKTAAVSDEPTYKLPEYLLIGAGTAAIQVEGAWNEDGKTESNLDHIYHLGKLSAMGVTDPHAHDVAADSYHRFKEDIAMASALKLQVYRFSLSWSRILPKGTAGQPNPTGVRFYHNVIDEVLRYNMTPMVTISHFDHPQVLEDLFNGWWSPHMIPYFKEYARFVFNEYGSKVKYWTTINEPNILCTYFAKASVLSGLYTAEEVSNHYTCQRNLLLGHAEAYRAFKEDKHEGSVGMTILFLPALANSTSPEDVYAAEAVNSLYAGTLYDPVVFGDYSQNVKDFAGHRLEPFSDREKELLKGSVDYIGMNIYNGVKAAWKQPTGAEAKSAAVLLGGALKDLPKVTVDMPEALGHLAVEFFEGCHPEYLRSAVLWAWQRYKMPIIITENGLGDMSHHEMRDQIRAAYYSASLRTLVSTINDFGVKVISYCAWSLIDSFEWSGGFSRPFGLVHIDYENKTLNRSLKDSSAFWIKLAETRTIPIIEPEYNSSSSMSSKPLLFLIGTSLLNHFVFWK